MKGSPRCESTSVSPCPGKCFAVAMTPPSCSPRATAEAMELLAPGGGYVFTQVHNIQMGTPPENILAMFDAAQKFGRYMH